jgi:hypothetical protein
VARPGSRSRCTARAAGTEPRPFASAHIHRALGSCRWFAAPGSAVEWVGVVPERSAVVVVLVLGIGTALIVVLVFGIGTALIVVFVPSVVVVFVPSIGLVALAQPIDGRPERSLSHPALKGSQCPDLLRRNPCVEP